MLFALRKAAAQLLMPLPLLLAVGLAGWLLWRRGRRRIGRGMMLGAVFVLWVAASTPVARLLVGPLESRHPAFPGDSVAYVVVLGGGHTSVRDLPLTALPNDQTLYRIAEGVRITTAQPWSTLVTSGYGFDDPRTGAELYRELAVALGVDSARIHTDASARTTSEEARALAPLLVGQRFALVTSATHMPRAVGLFQAEGLDPVPAPTGHRVKDAPGWSGWEFLPSPDALRIAQAGWYELLARVPVALGW